MKRCILVIGLSLLICGSSLANLDFTISEEALLSGEFSTRSWGPGNVSRMDADGEAVEFSFTSLSSSGTGLKDNYPVQDYGQTLPSHGSGDFSLFDGYSVWFSNIGQTNVTISLFVNTGFTGPSGVPSSDWTNDTFWQSSWQNVSPGESLVLRLDFDHARPFNISDNKDPHTHGTDGQWAAINAYDRIEISAIGFEVLGNGQATILVGPSTIPEPGTFLLFGLGVMMVYRKCRSI